MGGGGGFFFQAEDGIRDLVRSRWLGDVYKRQVQSGSQAPLLAGPGSHVSLRAELTVPSPQNAVVQLSLITI